MHELLPIRLEELHFVKFVNDMNSRYPIWEPHVARRVLPSDTCGITEESALCFLPFVRGLY